jgi:prophage regulatory protein
MMVQKIDKTCNEATGECSTSLQIIRHRGVQAKLRVSPSQLFAMIAAGDFPKPFKLLPNGRAVGWIEADVDAYILARKQGGQK